jgi:hypothetical protein
MEVALKERESKLLAR